jgi:hypothetical protein
MVVEIAQFPCEGRKDQEFAVKVPDPQFSVKGMVWMESETALEEKGKNKIERGIRIKPMKYFENILRNIMIFKDKKYLNLKQVKPR